VNELLGRAALHGGEGFNLQAALVAADVALVAVARLLGLPWLIFAIVLATAVHLALLRTRILQESLTAAGAAAVVMFALAGSESSISRVAAGLALLVLSAATAQLVYFCAQHDTNRATVLADLAKHTRKSAGEVEALLRTSTRTLAENWKKANIAPEDKPALAKWYADNAFYYLFDLAKFHAGHKHVAFTLDVMSLARGRCLEYGGGNGDLALELARRGLNVTYFDVPGATRNFAEQRAKSAKLDLRFSSTKEDIAAAGPYDTITTLDVLEHLPDLAGELDFLAAQLAPGGTLIATIPEGATANHPMHLDHRLDTRAYLLRKGLQDAKTFRLRWFASAKMRHRDCLVMRKPT
jgi:2-polyprenyl-3-methyl-5-hydroxy-6-metoxy-1,4-benzoquinol methylase